MSGGPVRPQGVTRPGRHPLDHRRSSPSRPPQPGLGADPTGISTGSMSGWPGPSPGVTPAAQAPARPPPVEPVETTAGKGWEPTRRGISTGSMSGGPVPAPGVTRPGRHPLDPRRSSLSRPPQPGLGADPTGHLDRLDERWPGPAPGSPGRGGTRSTTAGEDYSRPPAGKGWEPTLRGISTGSMSGGPVPSRLTRPRRHPLDPRRSSLSRPPQPDLGADPTGISTGSMSGGPVPARAHPAGEARTKRPPVEPVETTAARAGSRPDGASRQAR